jgi:hypothetical protein
LASTVLTVHRLSGESPRQKESSMKPPTIRPSVLGRVNWTVLLWAIGVPLPIVLIVALMRGCG